MFFAISKECRNQYPDEFSVPSAFGKIYSVKDNSTSVELRLENGNSVVVPKHRLVLKCKVFVEYNTGRIFQDFSGYIQRLKSERNQYINSTRARGKDLSEIDYNEERRLEFLFQPDTSGMVRATEHDHYSYHGAESESVFGIAISTFSSKKWKEIRDEIGLEIEDMGLSDNFYGKRKEKELKFKDFIELAIDINLWSKVKKYKFNIIDYRIKERIRTRYAMYDRPSSGLSNVIIDSFAPRCLYASGINQIIAKELMNAPKTAVAISPWFAKIFGVRQMEIEQMCRIIGYRKEDIKSLMNEVKKKKKDMVFLGYGGTGVNTLHWLSEMAEMTKTVNLFKTITIHEKEEAEFSNLLRFPVDPSTVFGNRTNRRAMLDGSDYDNIGRAAIRSVASKLNIARSGKVQNLSANKIALVANYYTPPKKNDTNTYSTYHSREYIRDENGNIKRNEKGNVMFDELKIKNENMVFYGAPDIATRQALSPLGHFLSATHGDDSCRIDLNPDQDQEIQIESYGIIQLGGFFMNQLRLAIGLLEVLASDQDMMEQDVELLNFSFKGDLELPTDRNYNFQLEHNGLQMTREDAAII